MSVYVALKEKGLRFELEPVDLAEHENQQEAYAELSLTRRVPTLLHENFSLSESSAITEYLDEVFTAPDFASLYPHDKQKRAKAREIQAWLRSDLMPIRQERSTEVVFAGLKPPALSEEGCMPRLSLSPELNVCCWKDTKTYLANGVSQILI